MQAHWVKRILMCMDVLHMVQTSGTGVDEKYKGSAVDVPTPKSLQDTVAWTPVTKSNF